MKEFNIYYADDDEDDLFLFEEAVETLSSEKKLKIRLHLLQNGDYLLETLKEKNSQNTVVFLDLNMPYKSGFELLQEIRESDGIQDAPVIIYSTSTDDLNISKSRDLGANYYAVKPNGFRDLVHIIDKAVSVNWKSYKKHSEDFIFNKMAI